MKRPSRSGVKPVDALRLDKVVVLINRPELESSTLIAKNSEVLQSRMQGDEVLVEDDFSLVLNTLYGTYFPTLCVSPLPR